MCPTKKSTWFVDAVFVVNILEKSTINCQKYILVGVEGKTHGIMQRPIVVGVICLKDAITRIVTDIIGMVVEA